MNPRPSVSPPPGGESYHPVRLAHRPWWRPVLSVAAVATIVMTIPFVVALACVNEFGPTVFFAAPLLPSVVWLVKESGYKRAMVHAASQVAAQGPVGVKPAQLVRAGVVVDPALGVPFRPVTARVWVGLWVLMFVAMVVGAFAAEPLEAAAPPVPVAPVSHGG